MGAAKLPSLLMLIPTPVDPNEPERVALQGLPYVTSSGVRAVHIAVPSRRKLDLFHGAGMTPFSSANSR